MNLTMIGTEVKWFEGDDDDPPGYVPFAKFSDGTLGYPPCYNPTHDKSQAKRDAVHVKFENGFLSYDREG